MVRIFFLAFFSLVTLTGLLLADAANAARRVELNDEIEYKASGPDGQRLGLADTRAAILLGATRQGFKVLKDQAGTITLEYRQTWVSEAALTVEVVYQAGAYSIVYAASDGLKEKANGSRRTISSTYVRWVRNLAASINRACKSGQYDASRVTLPPDLPPPAEKSAPQ